MKHTAIILLFCGLLSQGVVCGQTAAGKAVTGAKAEPLRFNTQFYESSAQYWAGVTFDYISSRGKRELNPAVRNSEGRINAGKFFALNSGVYALTLLLPGKAGNWTRRIVGWVHFGVGAHNMGAR